MGDLYGIGCSRCNREIAAAIKEMPLMDGYLSTEAYSALYMHLPITEQPKVYLDGEVITHVTAMDMRRVLWRGKVEIR